MDLFVASAFAGRVDLVGEGDIVDVELFGVDADDGTCCRGFSDRFPMSVCAIMCELRMGFYHRSGACVESLDCSVRRVSGQTRLRIET